MEREIVVKPLVWQKLEDIETVLFEKGYFSYKQQALRYVQTLLDFMYSIPSIRHYATTNQKYGAWYCKYKLNKNTTWFITFDKHGDRFIIRNIINNHTGDYPDLI